VGDIAYKNNHWSIVKKVNSDNTVTLIEQNWKWGGNQCKANRTVATSSLKYFRLKK
jgi:surface antigen